MKTFKILAGVMLVIALVLTLALPAMANENDLYGGTITRSLGTVSQGAKNTTSTNALTDCANMTGIGKVIVWSGPDNSTSSNIFTLLTSKDGTNYQAVSNAFVSPATAFTNVNPYFATPITNAFTNLLHGSSITTAAAATAGFAGPYLVPPIFTNTATVTIVNGGQAEIAFPIDDNFRYYALKSVTGNTGTNFAFGGLIEARAKQGNAP